MKNQSTEEILQNQYGGDKKAMQNDLKEEQNIRDKGLEKVEAIVRIKICQWTDNRMCRRYLNRR